MAVADEGSRRPSARSERVRSALSVVAALSVGGALTALLWQFIPTRLEVSTDTLGWPTRYNFNVFAHWYVYGLLVFVFPLSTLAAYAVLTHTRRSRFRLAAQAQDAETEAPDRRLVNASADTFRDAPPHVIRVIGVALVLGFETSVTLNNRTSSGLAVFVATAMIYIFLVLALVVAARRWVRPRPALWSSVSFVNALGTIACVLALYGVSRSTEVSIISTHSVRKVPWMPAWFAIIIAVGALIGLVIYLRRHPGVQGPWNAERWMILLVAIPVAFLVLHVHLPGDLGPISSFEEGQSLVGGHLLLHGAFPWRDVILTHGILSDGLVPMVGFAFFEVSRWGVSAAYYLFVEPIYWLLLYGLILYLTRARWVYALLFLAVIIVDSSFLNGFLTQVSPRFLPVPLVVAAFALLLKRPTWTRAAAFTGTLLVLIVVTPEAFFFVPAFGAVLVVFELYIRPTGRRLGISSLPRLVRCAVTASVWSAVLAGWLAWNNALGAFIFYYKTFVPAHILEGIPIENTNQLFFKAGMYVPISLAILFLGGVASTLFMRRHPRFEDWIASVLALGTVLYYAKFLGRADDGHLLQYLSLTTPFLFYVVYRVVDAAQSWLSRRDWRSTFSQTIGTYAVSTALVIGFMVPSTGSLVTAAQDAPKNFLAPVELPAAVPSVGYASPGLVNAWQFSDLRKIVTLLGGPRPRVWDFSNSPAHIYFFENFRTLTRYDDVTSAIQSSTQQDVISELRKSNPDVIVYNSLVGLTSWDGLPNMVRHYDISGWILSNYRALLAYQGYLLFVRRSAQIPAGALERLNLAVPINRSNLYTDFTGPCDWGYVPNFFAQHPAIDGRSRPVPLEANGRHLIIGGRISEVKDPGRAPVEVFLMDGFTRLGVGRIATNLSLSSSGPGFAFDIDVPLSPGQSPGQISTWVRTANGATRRITARGLPDPTGTIESERTVWEDQVNLPPDASRFHWLELTSPGKSPISPDDFVMSLDNEQTHGIYFATRSGAPRPFFVRLDNCTQWQAMPGAPVILTHNEPQQGLTLRLRE